MSRPSWTCIFALTTTMGLIGYGCGGEHSAGFDEDDNRNEYIDGLGDPASSGSGAPAGGCGALTVRGRRWRERGGRLNGHLGRR